MTTNLLAGLGLFLLGMTLMTDGLKAYAGRALRRILGEWVTGPGSALMWGVVVTALVQSSGATTVTAIGFVGSGIMTFGQAVGVTLGANIGSTTTGWVVALLGLKYSIVSLTAPLLLAGAAMKLFGRERTGALGLAFCGFSLIFLGMDRLQAGMGALADDFHFEAWSPVTLGGRAMLVLIGAGMAVVMQSSGTWMAAVLTAIHAGAVDFEHAAAMVIGQNIGSTVTATVAAIGGSAAVRRTALAHIMFNVCTGVPVFLLLSFFSGCALGVAGWFNGDTNVLALAAFHSIFNILGVCIFFPVIRPWSALLERMIPERTPTLTRNLDRALLEMPQSALEAVRRALMATMALLADGIQAILDHPEEHAVLLGTLDEADEALNQTRVYLARITPPGGEKEAHALKLDALHALDHLTRMSEDCRAASPLAGLDQNEEIRGNVVALRTTLNVIGTAMRNNDPEGAVKTTEEMSLGLAEARRRQRVQILDATAAGQLTPADATALLDAMRWIDRLGGHAWRATLHLQPSRGKGAKERTPEGA